MLACHLTHWKFYCRSGPQEGGFASSIRCQFRHKEKVKSWRCLEQFCAICESVGALGLGSLILAQPQEMSGCVLQEGQITGV